jgi:polyisoprenoid-binding protein YceI
MWLGASKARNLIEDIRSQEGTPVHATAPLPEDDTVRHVIDAKASNFVIQVFATGLLSAFGHSPKIAIRNFEGNVDFAAGTIPLAGASLHLLIQADSLEVTDDISARDRDEIQRRINQEVLDTENFREIVYQCSKVTASGGGDRYWIALQGELTMRGITRPVPVSAKVSLNGNSLRASGEFALRQSDFHIPQVTAAAGTIRVKDEVKCTFDIVARRQE